MPITLSTAQPARFPKIKGLNLREVGLLVDTVRLDAPHSSLAANPNEEAASCAKPDTRLSEIVDAWPLLPPAVQSTILALVQAIVGK